MKIGEKDRKKESNERKKERKRKKIGEKDRKKERNE